MSKLTKVGKSEVPRVMSLVKKEICGKFKGRLAADGRKERPYIDKDSIASPIVSLKSTLTTLVIDAYEGLDVAILDDSGAFL